MVRIQEKDMKFSDKLIQIMLSENELYKLRQKASWNEDKKKWSVPLFIFNAKQGDVAFPTINAGARVEQSKQERDLNFMGDGMVNSADPPGPSRKWQTADADEPLEGHPNRLNMSANHSDHRTAIHDPDMKWNAFSTKVSGNGASSQNVQHHGNGGGSSLRTARPEHNPMDLIPGAGGSVELNDRRKKYLNEDKHQELNLDLLRPNRRAAG